MTTNWELIADCLRAELAEYGGLLNLFESQQRSLLLRDADAVMRLAGEIEEQAVKVGECRKTRESAVAAFAREHGREERSTLRSMLPLVDPNARPLLEALINEVNRLLHRVRRVSRHNHTLLARAVEVHQQALEQLRPNDFTRTYSPAGRVSVGSLPAATTLSVAG